MDELSEGFALEMSNDRYAFDSDWMFLFLLIFLGDKIPKDIAKIMLDDFCQKRGINLDEQVKKEDE